MPTLYLKKQSDIDKTGHVFDDTCLALDNSTTEINLNTPSFKDTIIDTAGHGQKILLSRFLKPRVITCTFLNRQTRDNFLSWLITTDTIYLYDCHSRTQYRSRVRMSVEGMDKITRLGVPETFTLNLITELPFFESLIEKEIVLKMNKDISEYNLEVVNDGLDTPLKVEYLPSIDCQKFYIGLYTNLFVEINAYIKEETLLVINMKNANVVIDGTYRHNVLVGSPFNLLQGTNNLKIKTKGAGALKIIFTERFL